MAVKPLLSRVSHWRYPSKKWNGRGFEKIYAQGIISSIHGNNASSESRFGSEIIFIYERPEERPTDIVAHNGTGNEGGEGAFTEVRFRGRSGRSVSGFHHADDNYCTTG